MLSVMRPQRIKKEINFAPVRITMFFGDQELAKATAFHYSHAGGDFLVTCWHNVTGREPGTGECKSPTAGIPDRLKVSLPYKLGESKDETTGEGIARYAWKDINLPLYLDERHKEPAWLEHPEHRHRVDVVVLHISNLKETGSVSRFINEASLVTGDLEFVPGMDVFVLGFPQGMTAGGRFPIWKRGSLASEHGIDLSGLPMVYIDTATRKGMSGAPVIASTSGIWRNKKSHRETELLFESVDRFLGVYSGRVGDDTFQAQLGIVWKESAIIEIIEGNTQGGSAFYPEHY